MKEALPIALFILQEAIKNEPAIEAAIRDLFAKPEITADDWKALRAKLAAKTYADYVPESALTPAAAPAPALPPGTPALAVFTGQATDPHA